MSQIINKSAINVLDEFCKKKLQPPAVYEFTSDDVASDFVCTVKSFNETKTGKGNFLRKNALFSVTENINSFSAKSKKKAKHAAAQNLINHLRSLESFKFDLIFLNVSPNSGDDTVSSSTTNEKKRKANAKSEPEINYIGKLLEFCIKKKLPPASFDVIEHPASTLTNTQNHLREFFMKCRVNDVERQGKGFNKKQAKQTAAMEVLKVLMEGKSEPKDIAKLDEPPRKRLKSIEQPAEDTSSTPCENIVKIDNKGDHLNILTFV